MSDQPAGPHWRYFLRALADEVDEAGGVEGRDALLRGVGRRIARLLPLPQAADLDRLEAEINESLHMIGWGSAAIRMSEAEGALLITHRGLPRIGGAGEPPGAWLSALLEGLYEAWMAQLPGAEPDLVARRERLGPGTITLRYGR